MEKITINKQNHVMFHLYLLKKDIRFKTVTLNYFTCLRVMKFRPEFPTMYIFFTLVSNYIIFFIRDDYDRTKIQLQMRKFSLYVILLKKGTESFQLCHVHRV